MAASRSRSRGIPLSPALEIGIAYDLVTDFAPRPGDPADSLAEYDSEKTVAAIEAALRTAGHRPRRMGGGRQLLEGLLADAPDLVFNLAEGRGGRSREAQVPAACEMLGVPCTHSDPLTMAVTLDKAAAKRLVRSAGVPTPDFAVLGAPGPVDLEFPVVAKPAHEGSSMGIGAQSLVRRPQELPGVVGELLERYRQPVLVEEFCPGAELTVGVFGTGECARPLAVMEVAPQRRPLDEFLYSGQVKHDWEVEVTYHVPPRVAPAVAARAAEVALDACRALGCQDVARIDLRVDRRGEPSFLEANPLPGLHPVVSDLAMMARPLGVGYDELILRILACARERLGV
ncbi:MAG TPA: D-alanine--D-alanine ligase [Candidatus Dormibacteraeota bacterium]